MAGRHFIGHDLPGAPPRKPVSRVNFNIDQDHGHMMPPGIKVGKKHKVTVNGTVTGMRSDEYGHSFDMNIGNVQHGTTNDVDTPVNDTTAEPNSLSGVMKAYHAGRRVKP